MPERKGSSPLATENRFSGSDGRSLACAKKGSEPLVTQAEKNSGIVREGYSIAAFGSINTNDILLSLKQSGFPTAETFQA